MSEKGIAKEDILKASEGLLQKQLYVYFTRPTNGLEPVMKMIKEHLDYQHELEQTGVMVGAGPHWNDDETEWHGEGMVIIRADSLKHAREIAERDPMHASGAREFTIRPWLLNEGKLTIELTFSDGGRKII